MRYTEYSEYNPTGIEWLPQAPAHWQIKGLRHICRFAYGDSLAAENREEGEVAVYGSNGQVGTHDTSNTLAPVIVVGRKGSFGKLNYSLKPVFAIDTTYFIDQRNCLEDLDWLAYALQPLKLDEASKDSAVPGLAREDAYKHKLPVPPLDEQQTIARFLDAKTGQIDALVAQKRQLIAKLKEKRSALIARTVTRGLPPEAAKAAGLEPNLEMKDSGVGWIDQIPSTWKIERLRRVCRRVTDGAHISPDLSSDDFPFVSTVDITDGEIDMQNCLRTSVECYEYLVRTGCKPFSGDVLFSKDGTVGRTAVVDFSADFVVASSLVIISPDSRHLDSRFLDYWLNNSLLQQEVTLQMAGAALRRISVEKIGRLPVALPHPNEQQAIVLYLDGEVKQLEALVTKAEAAISRLTEYREALITSAVTGKIDVRGFANHEAEAA